MDERFCTVGEVELCYETFGDPADRALLLVMGLGTQMIAWNEDFCQALVERGFHVIRFDSRDCGRSSRIDAPPPSLAQLVRRSKDAAAYRLDDVAADTVGLLDGLGIGAAHVVGASMGGMVAQLMAARHPGRVLSLVSIMSNTGALWSGQPGLRLYPVLAQRPTASREAFVEQTIRTFELVGSPGFERDDDALRRLAELSWERGHDAAGTSRQLAAILATGDRTKLLRTIRVPTLVIHGTADMLVRPSGGRATARAIPGARLLMIEGMGHDLPRGAWPQIVDAIAHNAERAGDDVAAGLAGG